MIDEKFRNEPVYFAEAGANQTLRKWQGRLLSRIRNRLARGDKNIRVHIRCCHGAGKTFIVGLILLWWMSTRENARGFTTAPTWAQVSGLLWPEIRSIYSKSVLPMFEHGTIFDSPRISFGPKWFAVGASSDRPENLEGHHSETAAIRIIDEAKAVPAEIRAATQGLLDAPETLDIAISTPWTRSGWYYEQDALSGDPDLIREVVTLDDLIADGERPASLRDAWEREYGGKDSPHYRARVNAEYIEADPFGAVNAAALEACMSGSVEFVPGMKVVGLDVARSEDGDESVIAVSNGNEIVDIKTLRVRDTVAVAREAVRSARQHGAELIRVDAVGVGGGPVDIIRAEGWNRVEEFVSGSSATESSKFTNRYAEAADGLIKRINARHVRLPKDELLRSQILQVKYEPGAAGRLKVDKAPNGAKSPDRWDACLFALSEPALDQSARILQAFTALRPVQARVAA